MKPLIQHTGKEHQIRGCVKLNILVVWNYPFKLFIHICLKLKTLHCTRVEFILAQNTKRKREKQTSGVTLYFHAGVKKNVHTGVKHFSEKRYFYTGVKPV